MSIEIDWEPILDQAEAKKMNEAMRDLQAELKRLLGQIISISVVTPGYTEPNTVEGSVVKPVTDPARLLEAKEVSE